MGRRITPITFLIFTTMAGLSSTARADTFEKLTYRVSLNDGISGVSQILITYQVAGGTNFGFPDSFSAGSSSLVVNKDITPPFEPPEATLAIGLVTNIPGDSGTTLAVFGNFTAGEIGESFSTLFPDANESTLISDLETVFVSGAGQSAVTPFQTDVLPLYNDAQNEGLLIAPGGNFDVVAFTNGQLIGTGTFEVTATTPEPSSLLLFGSGLLGLIGMAYLQKRLALSR
jgi:PEP-CTERM motif